MNRGVTDMFPGADAMSIDHFLNEDWETWALERAHRIMVQEGANLMNAAQWLDKKQTIKSSQQLRNAIQQSLIEALALQAPSASQAASSLGLSSAMVEHH